MKIVELEQSTPEWLAWRQQGIGASDACSLMGDGYGSPEELANIKLGRTVVEENEPMRRGKRLEPDARRIYQQVSGIEVRPVCAVHPDHPWLRASLDGLSLDGKTVLEVKCPGYWPHFNALVKRIYPKYYKAQLMHQFLVTGAERIHYFSYRPDDPSIAPAAMVEVRPDHRYMELLFRREQAFQAELERMKEGLPPDLTTPPPMPQPVATGGKKRRKK